MNIFLFGATGGTGKEILIKLLAQKHKVFVLVRNLESLDITNDNLIIIKGDIYDTSQYENELSKCDAVISALGTGNLQKTDRNLF